MVDDTVVMGTKHASRDDDRVLRDLSSRTIETTGPSFVARHLVTALGRMRFQLAGALVAGVLMPVLIRNLWAGAHLFDHVLTQATWLCLASVLICFLLFRKISRFPGVEAMTAILPSCLFSFAVIGAAVLLGREEYSRLQLISSFALVTFWFAFVQHILARHTQLAFEVIPAGRARELVDTASARWVIVSDPEQEEGETTRLPVVADLRSDLSDEWERYLTNAALRGRSVYHYKQVLEAITGRVQIDHLAENSFGTIAPDVLYAPAKAILDGLAAAILLVFLSPLFLLVALAIRLESKGPAIFRQTRIGMGGKPFTIYKFRTMRQRKIDENVEEAKTRNEDERITKLGCFMRKRRIDELPQLLNILRGEMSFIGPRPEAVALSEWYDSQLPFYAYRHLVRPGITGWAQVNQGHITELDDARLKLEYDFYYVRHLSPWLDFYIVLRTFRVLLTGHGAK